jgi:hypothetical protein
MNPPKLIDQVRSVMRVKNYSQEPKSLLVLNPAKMP